MIEDLINKNQERHTELVKGAADRMAVAILIRLTQAQDLESSGYTGPASIRTLPPS
jgi:hypothetical protein